MSRFHIDVNGEPAKCNAKSEESCPRAKEGSPHGDSPENVQKQHEKQNQKNLVKSLNKTSGSTLSVQQEEIVARFSSDTALLPSIGFGTNEVDNPAIFMAECEGPETERELDEILDKSGGDSKNDVIFSMFEEDYSENSKFTRLMQYHDEMYDAANNYLGLDAEGSDEDFEKRIALTDEMQDDPDTFARVMKKYVHDKSQGKVKDEAPNIHLAHGKNKKYILCTTRREVWYGETRGDYSDEYDIIGDDRNLADTNPELTNESIEHNKQSLNAFSRKKNTQSGENIAKSFASFNNTNNRNSKGHRRYSEVVEKRIFNGERAFAVRTEVHDEKDPNAKTSIYTFFTKSTTIDALRKESKGEPVKELEEYNHRFETNSRTLSPVEWAMFNRDFEDD